MNFTQQQTSDHLNFKIQFLYGNNVIREIYFPELVTLEERHGKKDIGLIYIYKTLETLTYKTKFWVNII